MYRYREIRVNQLEKFILEKLIAQSKYSEATRINVHVTLHSSDKNEKYSACMRIKCGKVSNIADEGA